MGIGHQNISNPTAQEFTRNVPAVVVEEQAPETTFSMSVKYALDDLLRGRKPRNRSADVTLRR